LLNYLGRKSLPTSAQGFFSIINRLASKNVKLEGEALQLMHEANSQLSENAANLFGIIKD